MTLTDIANVALESLGAESINNLDQDDSAMARKIKRVLYAVIDDIQTIRNWSCLMKQDKLVKASKDPDANGEFKYNAPKNLLNVVSQNARWRRLGNYMLSESPALEIEYTQSNYDPSEWCKNLQGAVISKLKADIVGSIVGNRDLTMLTIQKSEVDIKRYMMNDINASKSIIVQKQSSWWIGGV